MLPSAATNDVRYTSYPVNNVPMKMTVVAVRAPFTRDLFAIAKFLVNIQIRIYFENLNNKMCSSLEECIANSATAAALTMRSAVAPSVE